ncbi:PREDICTED: zinc finger protein Elbow-like [Polistes canadensis]|uniref:zinc finger protein Elbow-like n=1 Tax=Polistes canadensis TaxID=91411 RepID=UPI000718F459|nr:PREDICTED: zinc finger protein Elbow-like [Polistes canadensis]
MLASNTNQYLCPDYLTPLPTTLDAKKSPLALLAQTCSQIGADPPSSRSLLNSSDKTSKSSKSNRDHSREGSSPSRRTPTSDVISRSNSKNSHESFGREKTSSPEDQQRSASSHSTSARSRTPGNNNNKRCSSNQSASSARAATPQGRKTTTPEGAVYLSEPSPSDGISTSSSVRGTHHGSPTIRPNSYSPAGVLAMTDPSIKDLPLGTFKIGLPPSTSSAYHLAYGGSQLPIDVMSAGSSLLSPHQHALKSGLIGSPTSPYLAYSSRLKPSPSSGTDASSSIGLCRDPYCTGCQLNSHLLAAAVAAAAAAATTTGTSVSSQAKLSTSPTVLPPSTVTSSSTSSCPSGCVQCDHKSGSGSPYGSGMSTAAAASVAAAAYAHAQLSALAAASQLPYVCNWMASDTVYCGKRFATSEELLQHLRSHTNASVPSSVNSTDPSSATAAAVATATALSMLSPPLPPPPPHSLALPSTHPFFSRTYPTPPLSPLATARYHPYSKPAPPMLPHSLSSFAFPLPPTHPAHVLPPPPPHPHPHHYFSPYSFYAAPRLGAASGLHQ